MSYYQEARAHVKALKQMSEDNKRRQERRAELYEAQNEHPLHALRIDGRNCLVHHSAEQYEAIERLDGLITWRGGGGGQESMIDRFDARAMLDMYIPPKAQPNRPKSVDELELEEMVAFESYRDLIALMQRRLSEEKGIAEAERQNVEFRAAARSAAAAAVGENEGKAGAVSQEPKVPIGNFGAVHFQYDDGEEQSASSDSESGSEDMDMDSEEEEEEAEATPAPSEEVAKQFGLENFDVLLRRELKREEQDSTTFKRPKRKRSGKKKAIARARRMAGQGLDPYAGSKFVPVAKWKPEQRREYAKRAANRGSPEYQAYIGSQGGGAQPSHAAHFEERVEFITEFAVGDQPSSSVVPYIEDAVEAAARPGKTKAAAKSGIREALPSQLDPSVEGPVALPSAGSAVHGLRASDIAERDAKAERERRAKERALEREHERRANLPDHFSSDSEERYGRVRARGRSRSRSRGRSRSRSRSRGRRRGRDPASRSRSRSGGRSRGKERSRSRERHRRRRDRSSSRSRSPRARHGGWRSRSRSREPSASPSRRTRGQRCRSASREGRSRHRGKADSSRSPLRRPRRSGSSSSPVAGRSRASSAATATGVGAVGAGKKEGGGQKKDTAAASGKKETPAERLKRIMASQLQKQVQKDNLSQTHKKVQAERDRLAREQQQRTMNRSRNSPPRQEPMPDFSTLTL